MVSPRTLLPRSKNDEVWSGTATADVDAPEIPETRGCRRSSNPPVESTVTLFIISPPVVVMVRKLLPFVLPNGPKLNSRSS